MADVPSLTLTTVNIAAPDPGALARFYGRLLGWDIRAEEPDWVILDAPDGGVSLSFETETDYVRPTWPHGPGDQHMMQHLEVRVEDLPAAVEHALAAGAVLADFQPQDDVRVCLDPAGHPFCLWLAE
jgi:catechol 2,3-dioxygenase-like lactoylglutathione lyase family enzyme